MTESNHHIAHGSGRPSGTKQNIIDWCQPLSFKICKSTGAPMDGFEHFGVRALSSRVANAPAAMGSRWRFVLFNPARGRRMLGTRGTLPRHASESSRQQGVLHRKVAGRLLGALLRMEKRTLHEFFCGMHNDLLASYLETRPLHSCAGTCYYCGTRGDGETTQWTFRLYSAGGIPTAAHGGWGATSRTGEGYPHDTGIPLKKHCRREAAKHTDSGTGSQLGLGAQ